MEFHVAGTTCLINFWQKFINKTYTISKIIKKKISILLIILYINVLNFIRLCIKKMPQNYKTYIDNLINIYKNTRIFNKKKKKLIFLIQLYI